MTKTTENAGAQQQRAADSALEVFRNGTDCFETKQADNVRWYQREQSRCGVLLAWLLLLSHLDPILPKA